MDDDRVSILDAEAEADGDEAYDAAG